MNNNCHRPHGGNFINGFVFGLIMGAALVFLFGTKKGKKLLQILSEEKLEDFKEFLDKMEDDEFDEEKDNPEQILNNELKTDVNSSQKKKRRFFKGIRRKD
ncbi:YtxH domain-containing protein [Patescibacteria group bacterium]|nr:YtxH domain-containing protein [Patescibacteria group bacterium]